MRVALYLIILSLIFSCQQKRKTVNRARDPWAFRSVLDKKPRMLTLALDTACYAAYDLAHCQLYKVWKGGVTLEGAAYTDKKNIQPTSWGTPYSDSLQTTWIVSRKGREDSFRIVNKGYRFNDNNITINYVLVTSSHDSILIHEQPEFINENGKPRFERQFTTEHVPDGMEIALENIHHTKFLLPANGTATLTTQFNDVVAQPPVAAEGEFDHRGRYWMEKSDCFTCHEVDRKTVGPSLQQIAGKYGNEENPNDGLVSKVKNGSTGVWGSAVMTPHPDLTESEISVMLDYIFTLQPKKEVKAHTEENKSIAEKTSPGFGAPVEGIHPSYAVQTIHNSHFRPRVGGLAFMPDGKLLVTTWDTVGGVYLLDHVSTGDTAQITVKRIASGLAEPLGITVVNNEIFVLQKQELTQMIDHNGDEVIDEYRAICNSWSVTGDFHEFAFGLVYKDGYFYVTLSMAMRLMSHEKQQPDRGHTIKISRDGSYQSINYGLRTPNGIGVGPDDEIFITDNQGEWVPANKLIHLKSEEYHGMRWGFLDSLRQPPEVALPAIYLPENEIGNSPSEPVLVNDGPYKGQMLHGDVTYGGIQRDFLEMIEGQYQGCVFRFTQGLEAGINRMKFGPDGALYVGGVGMVGGWSWKEKQYGLQRITYTGKPVFEMLSVQAKHDGFDITFTEPVSDSVKISALPLKVQQWWYLPTADYGGPKKDLENLSIASMTISDDRKTVHVAIKGLKEKHVVYFRLPENLKSKSGLSLWSGETWYTLNKIPAR